MAARGGGYYFALETNNADIGKSVLPTCVGVGDLPNHGTDVFKSNPLFLGLKNFPIPIKHTRSHQVYAFSPQATFDTKLASTQKVQLFYQFVSTSTTGVLVTNIMYTPDKM